MNKVKKALLMFVAIMLVGFIGLGAMLIGLAVAQMCYQKWGLWTSLIIVGIVAVGLIVLIPWISKRSSDLSKQS